jgi:hypothetical protein
MSDPRFSEVCDVPGPLLQAGAGMYHGTARRSAAWKDRRGAGPTEEDFE